MNTVNVTHKKVTRVALEDVIDDQGLIVADGIVAEDVVSESLAVLLPAGTSLSTLRETYPRIMLQLSRHNITYLKIRNFEPRMRKRGLSVNA